MNILVAEDHELTRFKLKLDLEKWGHEVVVAEDGERAWELFQTEEFPIVITDWMMPNMNGMELVRKIRASTDANYVYIIMLTAKAEKHDIVAGMSAGADDFLAKPFHRDELHVRLRSGIRITTLNRELNENNQRMRQSLEAAAEIQQSFLPRIAPEIPGFHFAWDYSPCDELGGDMLNIVPLDDSRLGVYVLDVSGHGVPAALLATTLSRMMSSALEGASVLIEKGERRDSYRVLEPAEVASRLNQRFSINEATEQFFTLAYGVLNFESRTFDFTCAGSPPVVRLRPGSQPEILDSGGFPIGIVPDVDDYEQHSVSMEPGDRLLIYSDGLPDTMNESGESFGTNRLLDSLSTRDHPSLDELIRSLKYDLGKWRGGAEMYDDVSVLGISAA